MTNFWTIYRRECSSYFNSPIAYIIIVVFLLFMSALFFTLFSFFAQQNPDFRPFFEHFLAFGIIGVILIPAVTMRLWSEEQKQGTVELLLTLPMKSWEIVLGKFLAGYTVVAAAIILTVTVPISISFVVEGLDVKAIVAMYIGILLIAGVYISLGAFISALTENQITAFLFTCLLAAVLCVIGFPPVITWFDNNIFDGLGRFLGSFGTYFHYQNFAKGLLSPVDFVYAISMTGLFILLNNVAVEGRKF